jgi:hypothetical protein
MLPSLYPFYSEEAKHAVARARASSLNYGVQLLRAPNGTVLAVIGEAHLKLAGASAIGKALVKAFDVRGVEGFPKERVLLGRALYVLIVVPRILLRALSLGLVKDSTIVDAKAATHGHTFGLETVSDIPLALHAASVYLTAFFSLMFTTLAVSALAPWFPPLAVLVPWLTGVALLFELHTFLLLPAYLLRRHSWSWLVHPLIGILAARDATMAEGTIRMLEVHSHTHSALIVLGRAHLRGFARELVEKYGFAVVDEQ